MNRDLIGWLLIVATMGLLVVLKEMHLGVINFKLFVLILILWSLGLVTFFRTMADKGGGNQ